MFWGCFEYVLVKICRFFIKCLHRPLILCHTVFSSSYIHVNTTDPPVHWCDRKQKHYFTDFNETLLQSCRHKSDFCENIKISFVHTKKEKALTLSVCGKKGGRKGWCPHCWGCSNNLVVGVCCLLSLIHKNADERMERKKPNNIFSLLFSSNPLPKGPGE